MPRPLTNFGKKIKMELIKKGVNQKEYCEKIGITANRLTDIMYGLGKYTEIKKKVAEDLGLEEELELENSA